MLYFPEAQLNALGLSSERIAGIKVRGDSMEETLADGDWVLINQADTDYQREGCFCYWSAVNAASNACSASPVGRCISSSLSFFGYGDCFPAIGR
ncbi:S24/S26 family peptidase [Chromohalobacter sarecensis]|nr:S24/S26 family peptidase [Chromohalobacter sarecensis]MCK0713380.1 S24/S26 family peptidase [Chromohalobacter sarecensis]